MDVLMTEPAGEEFDSDSFLRIIGRNRTVRFFRRRDIIFHQGDPADSVFLIREGKIKLSLVSSRGKNAVIGISGPGLFFGEGCLSGLPSRMTTATALSDGSLVEIDRSVMLRAINRDPIFAQDFVTYLIAKNIRAEEDIVDHLFNSSERRLARVLLLLSNIGHEGRTSEGIAHISQETLAEMVGTTRSRVSYFLNKFRRLGLIKYDGELFVMSGLTSVLLED